jgi:preprotein translocase subunit YajC
VIELSAVSVGDKLRLVGGITAEVLEIVNDEWAKVRLIEVPNGEPGVEELCHATDIVEVV